MEFEKLENWLPKKNSPLIIAGPCGAESREQIFKTAEQLAATNKVSLFRSGIWKPRTRPNSFEGRGEEALKWLQEIKLHFDLKTTVEVASAYHVEQALKYGIDVLWIGARSTVNPFTVQEIANSLKGVNIPVMVKNPIHADLQLWIGAIERIYNSGIKSIAAVHRGFHFYGKTKHRNKPLWQIPIELRTLFPSLPIICDPSHISGNRDLIEAVSQKALDIGLDGLMIEVHCNPSEALSDAEQQLDIVQFENLLSKLKCRETQIDNIILNNKLNQLRKIIDEIDDDILNSLKKRISIIEKIGSYKKEHNMTIFQLERWQEILRTRGQWADNLGLSRQHIERLCQLLHEESIRVQNGLMNK